LQKAIPEPYAKKEVDIAVLCGPPAIETAIPQLVPLGQLTSEQIRSRMQDGGAVAIARVGNEVAGYMWLSFMNGGMLVYDFSWTLAPLRLLRQPQMARPRNSQRPE